MLKRFAAIKGVGPYSNCSPGSVEFRKTSLVFGFNTYGKSTLCEVLRSLEIGDTKGVEVRATIPGPVARLVSISFAQDGKGEVPIVLKDSAWTPASPAPFRIQVFDTGFVSRNLYTGPRAERSNKEALSQFVLGEQGVKQANTIAAMRKRLAETKAEQRRLAEQMKDVGDVDGFVGMQVNQTEEALNAELRPVTVDLAQKLQSLRTYESIQGRSVLSTISVPAGDPSVIEKLNNVLEQSVETSHHVAAARLEKHVQEHMSDSARGPHGWLHAGLGYISGPNCPFCEQPLANAPEGLINAYKQYFDEDFNNRMTVVAEALSTFDSSTSLWGIDPIPGALDRNTAVLAQYRELEEDEAHKKLLEMLNELSKRARDALDAQREALKALRALAQEAAKQKRQAMYAPVLPVDIAQYVVVRWAAVAAIKDLNEHIAVMNEALEAFKRKSGKEVLEGDIKKLTEEEKRIKFRLRRVNSAGTCTAYAAAKQGVIDLDASIVQGEKALATEQSDYLKAFFDKINFYFTCFGSRHFTIGLEGGMNTLGYQPVLSLVVKYRGVVVNPQVLGAVFSESDRRALALSIYWAKMAVLPKAERASTIAVLDDPVTSFDDARITSAIIQMRTDVPTLRQLIVFTHYHAFTRRWLDAEQVSGTMGFHALTRNDETAGIVMGDPTEFLHTEHQKQYAKFQDFIAGKTNEAIGVDLRVFLETEVRERYRHQLSAGGKLHEQFEGVINYLAEIEAIPGEVAAELHFYRTDLNGPHHVANPRGRDDWATTAEQMLRLVYTRL